MIPPRWHKVISDLSSNKVRTLLVVLSIGIGVFAVGVVSSMYLILLNDLNQAYQATNPHGAIIISKTFDQAFLDSMRKVPGVAQVEGRNSMTLNLVDLGGKRVPINLTAGSPIDERKIDYVSPVPPDGKLNLKDDQILLERSVLPVVPLKVGDKVQIEMSDGHLRQLTVSGFYHDLNAFPYLLSNQLESVVTPATLENLGGDKDFNSLYLTVSERPRDEAHVRDVAKLVANKVEKSGRTVFITIVYKPGEHPANSILQAILGLLLGLGVMAVFLSGFLVVNTITALLAQHTRQIGMMKAIGGRSGQIMTMYIILVSIFGLLSLAIAMPLGALVSFQASKAFANLVNFDLLSFRIPTPSIILELIVALGVPLIAASIPVWKGTHVTVQAALSTYGISSPTKPPGRLGRLWIDIETSVSRFFSRPLLISLRNTFRRKGRLFLTLSTLTLGGAIFIAVFNVQAALNTEIEKALGYFMSDLNVSLNQSYREERIAGLLKNVSGVEKVEGWYFGSGDLLSPDKFTSQQIIFLAPPANSTLIHPFLTSGRWILPGDENALVIGNHVIQKRPDLKVGDDVTIKINTKETRWHIVGVFRMAGNMLYPIVYTSQEYMGKLTNSVDRTTEYRLATNPSDPASQDKIAEQVRQLLKREKIGFSQVQTGATIRAQQVTSINIIIYMLLAMAVLIALVGGLGLMGTMGMNVIERTREIGVMRAIGASDGAILRLVLIEGMIIGTISWFLAIFVAIPITQVLNTAVGVSIVTVPLKFVISQNGFMLWLFVVLFLSALASFLPARNASRLTVREVLAYE